MNFWQKYGTDIKAGAAMLLALLIILSVRAYVGEQEVKIRLEQELKATKLLLDAKDIELKSINRTMAERDKKTAELVKQVEALKARPIPVREIVKEIPKYIPIDSPTVLPMPQGDGAVFDPAQMQGLRVFYLDCQAKTLRLQACEDNAADWKRKELTWQEKEKLLEQQRDAALRAYKGGSFWSKFKRDAKTLGIGVAVGVGVGVLATR